MTSPRVGSRHLSLSLAAVLLLANTGKEKSGPPLEGFLRIVSERVLPPPPTWVSDVRWAPNGDVFLASPYGGVYRLDVSGSKAAVKVIPRGSGKGEFFLPVDLGVSADHLAVGAPVGGLAVKGLRRETWSEHGFAAVADLDVSGDRIAILGAQRGDDGAFAPDGTIGWIGSISSRLEPLRALVFSPKGRGARDMDSCALMDVSAARFLPDGSLILIPGVSPGIFLFGPDGKLRRTWQTEKVGIDAGCGLDDRQTLKMSMDPAARAAWVNQRAVVDEILPTSLGPAVVVRTHRGGVTRWQLKRLEPDGGVTSKELPLSSPSPLARLRGDVKDGRAVLLIAEHGNPTREQPAPAVAPRLIVAQIS